MAKLYHLHVETWPADRMLSEMSSRDPGYNFDVMYGLRGARRAAEVAREMKRSAAKKGLNCAVIRRDAAGAGKFIR
jgi:hypothetical protein